MIQQHMSTREPSVEPYLSSEIAKGLEKTQISKYHAAGGHGFAAEDANHFADWIRQRRPELVGPGNEKNGADRIVGGVPIQTKYHQTPSATVRSAFDSKTGLYRYQGQVLEVPKDQYEECVEVMRKKIAAGSVPGVSDPQKAEELVRSGSITYKQARNIAKAGNIESIVFDVKTQAVTSLSVFAISFVVHFARHQWNGDGREEALKHALRSAVAAGAIAGVSGVVTAQVLRTRAASVGTVVTRKGVKAVVSTPTGKAAVEKLAQASLGKAIHGAAAVNHVAKLMRTNAIASVISTAVTSTPDLYRAVVTRDASWSQFGKNLTVNAGGTAAGAAGWWGGAAAGAALGSVVPGPGTAIGGIVGGLAGALVTGLLGTAATKRVLDVVIEDDTVRMIQLLDTAIEELANDYLLSEHELEELHIVVQSTVDEEWLRRMYQAGASNRSDTDRQAYAYNAFDDACVEIVQKRPRVTLPSIEMVDQEIHNLCTQSCGLCSEDDGASALLCAA